MPSMDYCADGLINISPAEVSTQWQ